MYRNVMVAVDNSECSNYALDLAVDVAKVMEAKLTGDHVYAARLHDERFRQLEPALPERYQADELLQRQRRIHDDLIGRGLRIISDSYLSVFAERCRAAGVTAEGKLREGRNYEELVKDAQEGRYDLVVIGAHGLGRVERSVLGSVCERVVRMVDCDVLVVRNGKSPGLGKLLVAMDGSMHSFLALRVAIHLSRVYGSPLLAVAAYDPFFHSAAFKGIAEVLSPEASKLFRFREQESLHDEIIDEGLMKVYRSHLVQAQKIAEKEGIALDIEVIEGKPFDAIARYVAKVQPSLLLVGRAGIHHGEGVTLGSTAENLLRFADCNVLVVSRDVGERAEAPGIESPAIEATGQEGSRRLPWVSALLRHFRGTAQATKGQMHWHEEAERRLNRIPPFARPMARRSIERLARENGYDEITLQVYEQARRQFGM